MEPSALRVKGICVPLTITRASSGIGTPGLGAMASSTRKVAYSSSVASLSQRVVIVGSATFTCESLIFSVSSPSVAIRRGQLDGDLLWRALLRPTGGFLLPSATRCASG